MVGVWGYAEASRVRTTEAFVLQQVVLPISLPRSVWECRLRRSASFSLFRERRRPSPDTEAFRAGSTKPCHPKISRNRASRQAARSKAPPARVRGTRGTQNEPQPAQIPRQGAHRDLISRVPRALRTRAGRPPASSRALSVDHFAFACAARRAAALRCLRFIGRGSGASAGFFTESLSFTGVGSANAAMSLLYFVPQIFMSSSF